MPEANKTRVQKRISRYLVNIFANMNKKRKQKVFINPYKLRLHTMKLFMAFTLYYKLILSHGHKPYNAIRSSFVTQSYWYIVATLTLIEAMTTFHRGRTAYHFGDCIFRWRFRMFLNLHVKNVCVTCLIIFFTNNVVDLSICCKFLCGPFRGIRQCCYCFYR